MPILKALEGFHHRAARGITRLHFRYFPDEDRWERPPTAVVLERAGLHPVQTYLDRHRRYLIEYARTSALLDECRTLRQSAELGNSNRKLWWSGTVLDLDQNGPNPLPGNSATPG